MPFDAGYETPRPPDEDPNNDPTTEDSPPTLTDPPDELDPPRIDVRIAHGESIKLMLLLHPNDTRVQNRTQARIGVMVIHRGKMLNVRQINNIGTLIPNKIPVNVPPDISETPAQRVNISISGNDIEIIEHPAGSIIHTVPAPQIVPTALKIPTNGATRQKAGITRTSANGYVHINVNQNRRYKHAIVGIRVNNAIVSGNRVIM